VLERWSIDRVSPGAIAQLGERLLCKQEVTGSIPVGSTRANQTSSRGWLHQSQPDFFKRLAPPEPITNAALRARQTFRAGKKEFLLIFDIVDRNATGRLVRLPCCGGLLRAKACEANSVAGDRLLNGQAGKKDEVLSKEAGDRVSETLFSVCDGWYRSSV
jgi:hypothetical protein